MDINFNKGSHLNFKYKSRLKDLFKQGKLDLKLDAYGFPLTADNVTLEHIKPHSKNGANNIANYLLVSAKANQSRGNKDFKLFLEENPSIIQHIMNYLNKMRGIIISKRDYVEEVSRTLNKESGLNIFG